MEDDTAQPLADHAGEQSAKAIGDGADADLHADIDALVLEGLEEAVATWRVAESLKSLRNQVNAAAPNRSKASDGTIGDAAHATRDSDHNPWVVDAGVGVVTAMDITHDPAHGCDAGLLADTLRKSRDSRIKYIISNRRIASSEAKGGSPAWAWRTYTGSNPHNKHCHISVLPEKPKFDSTAQWPIADAFGAALESLESDAGDSEGEIERATAALSAVAQSDAPPAVRLVALQEESALLLSALAAANRAAATEDDITEAPAPSFASLKGSYEALFASCVIPASQAGVVAWHRKMILKGRARYEEAAAKTGVPWWFIGIVHGLEASFNFQGHLHNGDPLGAKTVQVPKGRPPKWNPPSDWLSSAIDALQYENFTGQADWTLARCLYRWEAYNGWGYRKLNINTPYLWSFSNHYTKGKYVADGKFDPNAVSKQCGAAVMLKALRNAGDVAI